MSLDGTLATSVVDSPLDDQDETVDTFATLVLDMVEMETYQAWGTSQGVLVLGNIVGVPT